MKKQLELSGLTHISEILPAALKKAGIKPKKASAPKPKTRDMQKWEDAVVLHSQQPYGSEEKGFMPGQLVQCTFPHDDPGNVPEWSRSTPWLTVSIRPGYKTDPKTKQRVCVGYPFGTIPRLIMFHIMTEAEYKKNRDDLTEMEKRTINFGKSYAGFLREIGMNPDNGSGKRSDRTRCHDQMQRTVRAIISFDRMTQIENIVVEDWLNMPISARGRFFWDTEQPEQGTLFESYVVLSEEFYRAMLASPVPLNLMAIRALKDSALHLDLYAWFLYRAHLLRKGGKPSLTLPWNSFMMQLGCTYKHVRQFRAKVKDQFKYVKPFLKGVKVELLDEGITIHAAEYPAIPPKAPLQLA